MTPSKRPSGISLQLLIEMVSFTPLGCYMRASLIGVLFWASGFAAACGSPGSAASPSAPPVSTPRSPALAAIAPLSGTSVANICSGDNWQFRWSDAQATAYHLQVFSPSGAPVLDRADIPSTNFVWSDFPPVAEGDRRGWRWRVQASAGGTSRDWTPEQPFDVDPPSPKLLVPALNAIMDNTCTDARDPIDWTFTWSTCRDASRYHLTVIGPFATFPAINVDTLAAPTYTSSRLGGVIADGSGKGWKWQVRAFRAGAWTDFSPPSTFDVEPLNTDCASLGPPTQLSPANGAVFSTIPRTVTFTWQALAGASNYGIDIEFCPATGCSTSTPYTNLPTLSSTSYTVQNFVGAQPGRWRVWGISGAGVPGTKSEWREFRFTQ